MVIKLESSPKHRVNKAIAWLCSFGYLVEVVLCIYMLLIGSYSRLVSGILDLDIFSSLKFNDVVLFSVAIIIILFLVFCLNFFEWILNPVFEVKNNTLIFKSDTVIAAMGRATTTYTIHKIDRYKKNKNSILIWGSVSIKEPLGKSVDKGSCEISCLYSSNDMSKVLHEIEEFKNEK